MSVKVGEDPAVVSESADATVRWLLDVAEPGVRSRTSVELLGVSADDPRATGARSRRAEGGPSPGADSR